MPKQPASAIPTRIINKIVHSTGFSIAMVRDLQVYFEHLNRMNQEAYELRCNLKEENTHRDMSIDFTDYCYGMDGLIEESEPDVQFQFLLSFYATEHEGRIDRSSIMKMLQDHINTDGVKGRMESLYTWMKKYYSIFLEPDESTIALDQALHLLAKHPELDNWLSISRPNLIKVMLLNAQKDRIISNTFKYF